MVYNPKECGERKKVCPFFLLETSRPLSLWGPLDSQSTCLGNDSLKVVWYSHLFQNFPQFIVIHTVKGLGIVNKAEIDVFLELPCFYVDPVDSGNLVSGSSAFSKTILNIWKFKVHILLKPGLENFDYYFTSM